MARQEEGPHAACPTPEKSRFATHKAALRSAAGVQVAVGKRLYPYDCACGWVHLRSRPRKKIPATVAAAQAARAELVELPSAAFTEAVSSEVRATAQPGTSEALRSGELVSRWAFALRFLRRQVDQEFASGRAAADPAWAERARIYSEFLAARENEAADLVEVTGRAAELGRLTRAAERAIWRLACTQPTEFWQLFDEERAPGRQEAA